MSAQHEFGQKLYILIPFAIALEFNLVTPKQQNPLDVAKSAAALPIEARRKCYWLLGLAPNNSPSKTVLENDLLDFS